MSRFRTVLVPVAFWVVHAGVRLGSYLINGSVVSGNDDLARMLQVRNLLGGQGWFDLALHRLNPPSGVAMHWSRHSDVLVAPLVAVFGDEPATVILPLVLLLIAYVVMAVIGYTVGGREAVPATLLLFLASALVAPQFAPGRVDHHGLQIVLLLVAVAGILRFERPRWALVSGLAAGVSLTAGLEQLLAIGGLIVVAGVLGVRSHDVERSVRVFAGALLGGAVVSGLVFAPPGRLVQVHCDVFSLPHLLAIGVASLTLVALPVMSRKWPVLIGGGVVSGLAMLLAGPRCVDPYADVDGMLRELWLANVAEAQDLIALFKNDPGFAWALVVPGAIAVGFVIRRLMTRGVAGWWFRLGVPMLGAYAAAVIQFRGASSATALSAPVLAVVFLRIRERLVQAPMTGRALVMVFVVLVVSGLGPLVVGSALAQRLEDPVEARGSDCDVRDGRLADLDGVILAPIDLGPDLLVGTEAGVVAAPYHRNNEGNLRAWMTLMADPQDADLTGVDWVVVCEGMPENSILVREAPDGLLATLLDRAPPDSLVLHTALSDDALGVYRVNR